MTLTPPQAQGQNRGQIADLLADHCFTRDLPAEYLQRIVSHAEITPYAQGALLFREGAPADRFHLVVEGRVAVEMHIPGRGTHVVDTVEPCETVGWSWLVPPYRWFFDARAVNDVRTVTVDAVALRALADDDPGFGYALLQRVTGVMLHRMQASRVRLADLYRGGAA